jgi:hypothetical protein
LIRKAVPGQDYEVKIAIQETPEAMISLFKQGEQVDVRSDDVDAFLLKLGVETIERRRKVQLVTELQNLASIIEELMV